MGWLSSAIGAVGGIVGNTIGGLFGKSSSGKATDTNAAIAREQIEYQKELAKNQIQWRTEDAKKAGLHPMAALGLSPSSFSPVSSNVATPTDYSWIGDIGQNIDRAIMQGKTNRERQQALALQEQQAALTLRHQELQNELLEAELTDKRFRLQQQMFPATPAADSPTGLISGQNSTKLVEPEPMRITPHTETGKEPGSNPSVGWLQNPDGTFSPVMSDEAKNRLEDDFVGELLWNGRNRVMPHLRWVTGLGDNKVSEPPRSLLPKGAKGWRYTRWGSYAPVFD